MNRGGVYQTKNRVLPLITIYYYIGNRAAVNGKIKEKSATIAVIDKTIVWTASRAAASDRTALAIVSDDRSHDSIVILPLSLQINPSDFVTKLYFLYLIKIEKITRTLTYPLV